MTKAITLLSTAALGIGLSACGGGGSGLARDALAKRADRICSDGHAKQATIGPAPVDFRTNPVSAAAFLDKYAPILDEVSAKLRALRPAAAVRADWLAFESSFAQSATLIDAARTRARSRDASDIQEIRAAAALASATTDAAIRVGATTCAR